MDPISITAITALIVAIISGLGAIISRLRFKHCHMGCIDSDCVRTPQNSPPDSPINHHKLELDHPPIHVSNIII